MWVCKNHVTAALELIIAPHIQKAPIGMTCSFCDEKADINMYYAHKPSKLKRMKFKKIINKKYDSERQTS